MIPSEQMAAAAPAQVPAMRLGPPAGVATRAPAAPPAAGSRRGLPLALICGVVCGVLGLMVAPVLLGPAAIFGGFAGERLGRRGTRTAGAVVSLVAVVGTLVAVLALR